MKVHNEKKKKNENFNKIIECAFSVYLGDSSIWSVEGWKLNFQNIFIIFTIPCIEQEDDVIVRIFFDRVKTTSEDFE